MADTHYVIVVHGTWNPPQSGKRLWYQTDEADPNNFCTRLNERLEELGLARPVGRNQNDRAIEFHWTGANDHDARLDAAERLFELISDIAEEDPSARIHLVAHSHGGNVALKAIQHYLDRHLELAEAACEWPEQEPDEDWWTDTLKYQDWSVYPHWEQVELLSQAKLEGKDAASGQSICFVVHSRLVSRSQNQSTWARGVSGHAILRKNVAETRAGTEGPPPRVRCRS